MRTVRTIPRPMIASLIQHGDEVALYRIDGPHTPSQVCDCPKPDGRRHWHCANNWNFAKSIEFVNDNPASLLWALVVREPVPVESTPDSGGFFTVPKVRMTIVPVMNDRLGSAVPIIADGREPAVIRERVRIDTEGQPETVGITALPSYRCPRIEEHPKHVWPDDKHIAGAGNIYQCDGKGHPNMRAVERRARMTVVPGNKRNSAPDKDALRKLHDLNVIDVQEIPREVGEDTQHLLMRSRDERVGVAVGKTVPESDAVDFKSPRDSDQG